MLWVHEIFYSIQGESSYAGLPCVFIRLARCNLRCSYCDTTSALAKGKELSIEDIIEEIGKYNCKLIDITGGEPLFQKQTPALIQELLHQGYKVLVETNGSLDIGVIGSQAITIMDMKCPSSGEADSNLFENLSKLSGKDEIKFVIGEHADYEWAKEILEQHSLISRCQVLFAPVHAILEPAQLAQWILDDKLNVRLQLQIHKYLGVK